MPLKLVTKLSVAEIRYLVSIAHEHTHPDFIFFLCVHCQKQIATGTSWSALGTTELQMSELFKVCQCNHLITELEAILAKNQYQALDFDDAEKMSYILEEFNLHKIDWTALPFSKNALMEVIELAACGYEHCRQQTAS